MTIRTNGGPGAPLRWRGHVPMAEAAGDAAGAGGAGAGAGGAAKDAGGAKQETAKADSSGSGPAKDAGGAKQETVDADLAAAIAAERKALAEERAAWKAEREAAKTETDAARAQRETEIATKRREFVRGMGLAVQLSDEHLDAIVPKDADPRTDAGKVALNKFREDPKNRALFSGPLAAPTFDADVFALELCGGKEKAGGRLIFGPAHVHSLLNGGAQAKE